MPDAEWPADKVERVPVATLVPYARNARTHSPEQVDQIAASIKEWGWTVPVLVDETMQLIAGHGRVLAAQKLGIETVPVMTARGWSEAQKRAYVLADNQLAMNAGWDMDLLKIELDDLTIDGFDINLIGFDLDADVDHPNGTEGSGASEGKGSLAARFLVPPFSVLNAREGWWQDRKRAWLALGIQSELGRGDEANSAAPAGGGGIWGHAGPSDFYGKDKGGKAQSNAPGGSKRPATDYSKSKARGDGTGRAIT